MNTIQTIITAPKTLGVINTDALRKAVPAVYATRAKSGVSDSYRFVNTLSLVEELKKAGLVPVEARQYMRREARQMPYSRHMVKFRPIGDVAKLRQVGDVVPEVIVVNSHDRSARLQLIAGLFRLICSNGMVCGIPGISGAVSMRHVGDIDEAVKEALKIISGFSKEIIPQVERMMKVKLNEKGQLLFARRALAVKSDSQNPRSMVIKPADVLVARRTEDNGNSVWSVFNRVQENIIKGGLVAINKESGRERTTRPILSLATDLQINGGLWELALKTAEVV